MEHAVPLVLGPVTLVRIVTMLIADDVPHALADETCSLLLCIPFDSHASP